MSEFNRFSLMIDALTTLAEEEQAQVTSRTSEVGLPTLNSVLAGAGQLPHTALFLGLAEDGLSVLLDMNDPVPGPILIVGDETCGKTSFLQMIARATESMHGPADVQTGVITPHPDEWKNFEGSKSVLGVYSTREDSAGELLQSLVTWAHNNRENKQTILLLVDDLEAVTKLGQEAEQNLRWLLLRGPSRRVWPIITLNASRARNMETWLEFFRTRLFGIIRDEDNSHFVASDPDKVFNNLAASQFTMREGNNWLNFWAPALD
jgi:hypothetical protein